MQFFRFSSSRFNFNVGFNLVPPVSQACISRIEWDCGTPTPTSRPQKGRVFRRKIIIGGRGVESPSGRGPLPARAVPVRSAAAAVVKATAAGDRSGVPFSASGWTRPVACRARPRGVVVPVVPLQCGARQRSLTGGP